MRWLPAGERLVTEQGLPEGADTQPTRACAINGAALTLGELYRLAPNPMAFLFHAPLMRLMKLLGVSVPLAIVPREITLEPPFCLVRELAEEMDRLRREFEAVGFAELTSLAIPELGGGALMQVLTDPSRRAYASVSYVSAGRRISADVFSCLADDYSVTTVTHPDGLRIRTYPQKIIRYHGSATLAELWAHHQRSLEELAPQHGGVLPAEEDLLREYLIADARRFADFHLARGTAVPTG